MSVYRTRDLPGPGGQRKAPRRVSWPEGIEPADWTCLSVRPSLVWTHWCPGAGQRGKASRGRSAPCFAQGCPRCAHPRQFPTQEVCAYSALDPQGHLTTCLLPGHIADDVAADRAWSGDWRGTVLTLARVHRGPAGGVYLVSVASVDPASLPMPGDHMADLEVMWAAFLAAAPGDLRWGNRPDRDPGEEG